MFLLYQCDEQKQIKLFFDTAEMYMHDLMSQYTVGFTGLSHPVVSPTLEIMLPLLFPTLCLSATSPTYCAKSKSFARLIICSYI